VTLSVLNTRKPELEYSQVILNLCGVISGKAVNRIQEKQKTQYYVIQLMTISSTSFLIRDMYPELITVFQTFNKKKLETL